MILAATLLGVISSLHCVAMCGPIAMMLPLARNNPRRKAIQLVAYHAGRISTYAVLGFLFGAFGRALSLSAIQQYVAIFSGLMMVTIALLPQRSFGKIGLVLAAYKATSGSKGFLLKHFNKQSLTAIFLIGLLNGFLPCAMVYAALFGALSTQSLISGMAFMALFGLGTVPLMGTVTYLHQFLTLPWRNRLQRVIPAALVCIGILLVLRGMLLDICHVSPSGLSLFIKAVPNCK
ncbi:hypothetical protein HYN48_13020 [Flavobacterium magnum]|uniref:Urease accessory protein UreH-like transmembrane domain-containing protein n=1 Tax=Flavobacterium magnum TaxID=2162713 RepID=A0A2S0RIK9_9FLAO|nr:hypothetical protein HYN48_13020 [Flavobacterium magnum]